MELDTVTQRFLADGTQYMAELALMAQRADSWKDQTLADIAEVDAALRALKGKEVDIKVKVDDGGLSGLGAAASGAGLAGLGRAAEGAARDVDAAASDIGAAAGRAWRPWWMFGNNWKTFIHWIVAGSAEFLAVAVPAAIAAGATAWVLYQGLIEGVKLHLQALFTTTEATDAVFGKTTGDVLGLGHAFQTAQDAANPVAYSLLGAYLNIARAHMGSLATAGLETSRVLDTFAAKLTAELGPGGSLGKTVDDLISNMVPDLTAFGQVLGNLGHAILNFAHAMPGLAEGLLFFLTVITKAVEVFSSLPAPIITAFMALEEFNRWGSLGVGVLARLGLATSELSGSFFTFGSRTVGILSNVFKALPMLAATLTSNLGSLISGFGKFEGPVGRAGMALRNFGADMTDAIVAIPAWQAALAGLAVAGLAFLIYKIATAKTSMQQFTDALQQNINKASNMQAINVLATSIGAVNQRLAHTPKLMTDVGQSVHTGLMPVNHEVGQGNAALASYDRQLVNVTAGATHLANTYHTSFLGALVLADQAGVKLTKGILGQSAAAVQARIQIANLVTGYKAMGAPANAIGADMTALAIQSGLANTQVSKLNQAWDEFMTNLTAGTSGLAGFEGSLANLGTGIAHTKNNLSSFAGDFSLSTRQFAQSLNSFTGKGSQAWQNFNQVVGSTAPQLIDWLRTAGAEGAISGGQFTRAILEMTAQLVPLASKSAAAKAEVLGLTQQAGLNISTWGQLTAAIKNGHLSLKDLESIISGTTQKMANMSQVAKSLGTVLSSQVAAAVDQAKIKASGLNAAVSALANDMQHGGTRAAGFKGDLDHVVQSMGHLHQSTSTIQAVLASLGVKLTQAQINAILAAAGLEKTAGAAGDAGSAMSTAAREAQSLQRMINSLHGKTIHVNVIYSSGGVGGFGGATPGVKAPGQALGTISAAPGITLVGERGPELVNLHGGEEIVPAHRTSEMLSALIGANTAGSGGHVGTAEIHVHAHLDSKEVFQSVQTQNLRWQTRNAGTRSGLSIPGTRIG